MDVSSVQKLCIQLISASFQRCRVSEDICRLSVVLKCSPDPDPSNIRISVSDTGIGCCLEEFQDLRLSREVFDATNWDGVLSVRTTSICDDDIFHYHFNLRESISNRRLIRMPSFPKNGAKFSGTEVYLSISESIDVLLAEFNRFFRKMLILKIPNVAIELAVERGDVPGPQCKNVFLANECNPLPFAASNFERLKSGLEDYVLKHGNSLHRKCDSCFPNGDHLKVGSAVSCRTESHKTPGLLMEVVIIVSELPEIISPCFRACSARTEVLYFKDFSPYPIDQSSLAALTSIDWKSYGLVVGRVVDQGGYALLEWENLPPHIHIDMVLHCYHEQLKIPSLREKTKHDRTLIKKAVKLALDDLKKKNAGALLSSHALKICSYAPDLARSIAGLILSSNDSEFQEECVSLLGLKSRDIGVETIEDCIKGKIISVIERNDRKPQRSKEVAPFLFQDDCLDEPNFQDDNDYDKGEDVFSSLDY